MSYIDGFVLPVPSGNKEAFTAHAREMDQIFMEMGALQIFECWGDDVPEGKVTDFRGAVKAEENEIVVFSFVEWPDKETRNNAWAKTEQLMKTDPRFNPEKNPIPFDGKRMIYGGFVPVVQLVD